MSLKKKKKKHSLWYHCIFLSLLLKNTVRYVFFWILTVILQFMIILWCYVSLHKHILCAVRQGHWLRNIADINSACIINNKHHFCVTLWCLWAWHPMPKVVGHGHPINTAINVSIYLSYIKEKCLNFLLGSLIWLWREILCTLSSILQSLPVNICSVLKSWIPINCDWHHPRQEGTPYFAETFPDLC